MKNEIKEFLKGAGYKLGIYHDEIDNLKLSKTDKEGLFYKVEELSSSDLFLKNHVIELAVCDKEIDLILLSKKEYERYL